MRVGRSMMNVCNECVIIWLGGLSVCEKEKCMEQFIAFVYNQGLMIICVGVGRMLGAMYECSLGVWVFVCVCVCFFSIGF